MKWLALARRRRRLAWHKRPLRGAAISAWTGKSLRKGRVNDLLDDVHRDRKAYAHRARRSLDKMAVFNPTTSPSMFTRGPPELP